MKSISIQALCLALCGATLVAADGDLDDILQQQSITRAVVPTQRESRRLKLDPKRIVNESNSFLKEREPEMNAEEYALYEKLVSMLSSNPQFAVRLLEAMISEKEKPSPAFEFILGNAYYAAGENQHAEQYYRSAVDRFPTFLRAWNNLGVLYYTTERFDEAIECFSKSVVLGDRDATTFGLLGYCLERVGNVVSAETAYMQALGGDPSSVDWKEGLLRIYIHGRQFGRAESLARNLIRDDPAETRFWQAYASILLSQERKLEAMAVLEVCAGAGLAGTDELVLLGDLYAEQNLIPEAIASYEKVFAAQPGLGGRKLLRFAQVLISGRRLSEAERVLVAAETGVGHEARAALLQTKADLMIARQQMPAARTVLEELLAIEPLNGRALLSLGSTYMSEEDLAHAGFAFEAAYRIDGSRYRASLELANLELKNRNYAKSADYLRKALSIQRTEEVEECLARVKALVPADT